MHEETRRPVLAAAWRAALGSAQARLSCNYLVRLWADLQWADVPHSVVDEIMATHDVDLSKLEWQATDGTVPANIMLRLALRYGIACSTGIAVPPDGFLPLTHIMQLIDCRRIDTTTLPGTELMEAIIPGWSEHSRQFDERVNESMAQARVEAGRELQRALAVEPKPELIEHWRGLGGAVPPT